MSEQLLAMRLLLAFEAYCSMRASGVPIEQCRMIYSDHDIDAFELRYQARRGNGPELRDDTR